jgi:hypothetical protein
MYTEFIEKQKPNLLRRVVGSFILMQDKSEG